MLIQVYGSCQEVYWGVMICKEVDWGLWEWVGGGLR